MKRILLLNLLVLFSVLFANGQKLPLTHDVYAKWRTLENPVISNDGKWICYEKNPQKGDGWLILYNTQNNQSDSIARGSAAAFSPSNKYLVFKILPQYDTLRAMKLRKVKKDKLPKDSFGVWLLESDSIVRFPSLKSFKLPESNSSILSVLFENENQEKAEKKDTSSNTKKPVKTKKQINSYLLILDPVSGWQQRFDKVEEYSISKNGKSVLFKTVLKDSLDTSKVLIFNTINKNVQSIFETTDFVKNLTTDDEGMQAAFLVSKDTSKQKAYSLYLKDERSSMAIKVIDSLSPGMPKGWAVSENGKMYFSKNGKRLFFSTSPRPEIPVTDTLTDEEKFSLDIWKWDDKKIQSQQNKELQDELKHAYLAVFDLQKREMFQIEDPENRRSVVYQKGNARYALLFGNNDYLVEVSWTGSVRNDVWLIDLENNSKKQIFKGTESNINLSPLQKYLYWYDKSDSAWFAMPVNTTTPINLTSKLKVAFYREDNDVPALPDAYGIAGWTTHDEFIIIYDQFDLWLIDPKGKIPPQNITNASGRDNKMVLRYLSLDKDEESVSLNQRMLLSIFDKNNMEGGFMQLYKEKNTWKSQIIEKSAFSFSKPEKAKNSDLIIWRKQNYQQFPELYVSKTDMSDQKQISFTNPQQKDYLWGNVRLFYWKDEDGKENKGLLYTPENFDSTRKYPMIVYYYERESENLFRHYIPKPSASVINFPLYNSNGYVIFVPDIWYKTGFPGESALKTVVSGTKALISEGFIDEKKIGLQGQSWGGYQTAYIITQTDIFCAAMAGAAVSNMSSAYTGIRWESGLSRMFQYEKGQSRIGKTLWEAPQLYIQNSPVFYADKIKTPLLMMNNDKDGAVPWQQGIELYSAMRRLQKPCWMLVYNNEEHNLKNWPNKVDLSIRMMQFFDHYLKDKPMPEWMKDGIPAIEKGKKTAY